jgi:hypothetical protein
MIGRRALMKGLGLMTIPGLGGQQPPPQNAAPAGQLTPGVTPGVSGQLIATRVIISGTGGELLVYTPFAGPGNLVASIAATEGTDNFGNAFLPNITSYNGSGSNWFANSLTGGSLAYFHATSAAGPWAVTAQILANSSGFAIVNFEAGSVAGVWPQSGGAGITTVAQVVAKLEAMGLLTP